MADTKTTALTADTDPSADDLLFTVNDPGGGTPANRKVTIANFKASAGMTASSTEKGCVELAIASEINTGTDAVRAVTPDALAGSTFGTRTVVVEVVDPSVLLVTGDGQGPRFIVPIEFNGMDLVSVAAAVNTVSSSGTPTVQVRNVTQTADMLSTRITIDATEKHSKDATAAAVIDTANDDVATGDEIAFDIDVAGTGTKGLTVIMGFQLP